jgi:hypothetical protein
VSGFEAYAEWARQEVPRSIRDLLELPQHTQGYTLGMQWASPPSRGRPLRVQGEVTYLEQTQLVRDRPTLDYYAGRATVHGFTQRGQILGASIGPGSSSQFLAADWLPPHWQVGVFAGRTRTENDALYREGGPRPTQHDVTLYSGVRGGLRLPRSDVSAAVTIGRRYNYLLQSSYYVGLPVVAADFPNTTVAVTISPR